MKSIFTYITSFSIIRSTLVACILLSFIPSSKVHAQDPVITKTVTESVLNCLEYDVDLTVSGHAVTGSDVPLEVITIESVTVSE